MTAYLFETLTSSYNAYSNLGYNVVAVGVDGKPDRLGPTFRLVASGLALVRTKLDLSTYPAWSGPLAYWVSTEDESERTYIVAGCGDGRFEGDGLSVRSYASVHSSMLWAVKNNLIEVPPVNGHWVTHPVEPYRMGHLPKGIAFAIRREMAQEVGAA